MSKGMTEYLHLSGFGEERLELVLCGGESKVTGEDLLVVVLSLDGLDVVGDRVDDALVRIGHCD